ncbi:MAG: DUF4293 domain-containing protein [Muribaculaceae bacterium]|nr:DUF4293 domain-containing protein [Muribaculaceae bacterium]
MVIQRWQSVLLLMAVVLMGVFSFVSLGQIQTAEYTFNFTALGISPEGQPTGGELPATVSTWYLFALSVASAALSLIAIFSFRNLQLQKRLCLLSVVMLIGVIVVSAVIGYRSFDGGTVSWSSIICAPFLSLIADIMAYQRISADQRTIRESERLR